MSFDLPPFLRHRFALHRAHRALERSDPFSALKLLSDPELAEFATVLDLRRRALDLLARGADEASALGDEARRVAILEFWAGFDAPAVEAWRARRAPAPAELVTDTSASSPPTTPSGAAAGGSPSAAAGRDRPRLEALLAQMRTRSEGSVRSAAEHSGANGGQDLAHVLERSCSDARAPRFRLAVDDAGEFLVAVGHSFVLGHAHSRTVDLPFLADVEAQHARLELVDDFHSGPRWCLVPSAASRATSASKATGSVGETVLRDGDVVRLAQNLVFRWCAADPSSSSAVLELLHGAECLGASRILLFVPGPEGRVRIGERRTRPIRVAGLAHEIALEVDDSAAAHKLVVTCSGSVQVRGAEGGERTPAGFAVPCPPAATVQFAVDARLGTSAPFGLVVVPLDSWPRSGSESA